MGSEKDITLDVKEALEIDIADILEELRRQPSKYFYYGVLWARASKNLRQYKLRLRELESKLASEFRSMVTATDPKARVTEALRTEYLLSRSDYVEAEKDVIQAEYLEEVLDITRDAMKQRNMALQELARQNREESLYGDEFRAMKKEYNERVDETPKKRRKRMKEEEVTYGGQAEMPNTPEILNDATTQS